LGTFLGDKKRKNLGGEKKRAPRGSAWERRRKSETHYLEMERLFYSGSQGGGFGGDEEEFLRNRGVGDERQIRSRVKRHRQTLIDGKVWGTEPLGERGKKNGRRNNQQLLRDLVGKVRQGEPEKNKKRKPRKEK